MLCEISQTETDKYYMISLTHGIWKKTLGNQWIGGCQGLGSGRMREMLFKGPYLQPVDE